MHLAGTSLPQELHQRAGRVAAHDGVVHQHHAAPLQVGGQRVVLQAHSLAAQLVIRLDEGAANVAVLGQPLGEGNARLQAVANGVGRGRVGHANHDVGVGGSFAGKLAAHALAHLVHDLALEARVGAGEVDVFENAERPPLRGLALERGDAVVVQAHDFARLHLAQERGPHGEQRAGLRGHHVALVECPQAEGAQPQRVTHGVDGVSGENHQRVGPLRQVHEGPNPLHPPVAGRGVGGVAVQPDLRRGGQHLGDDFAVAGGGKPHPPLQQEAAQLGRVGQVAVVSHTQGAMYGLNEVRLGVADVGGAGGGIAVVANGHVAPQGAQVLLVEHLRHQPHALVDVGRAAVAGGDAGALLSPVLKGVEPEKGDAGHVTTGREDAEDATCFL